MCLNIEDNPTHFISNYSQNMLLQILEERAKLVYALYQTLCVKRVWCARDYTGPNPAFQREYYCTHKYPLLGI